MVLRPVGDLPPRVYWVRRLLLLVVLVVVALLLWWLWPSGGGDTSATGGQQTSPTPTVSSTPSSSPEPSESKTKKTATPSDAPPCADDDIEVTVRTDSISYPAGEDPTITFFVENVSEQTCVRDVGSAVNELSITSGGATVWSSDFCSPGGTEELETLTPGDSPWSQEYVWTRVLASEGCPTPQEQADPGTYQVRARNGGVGSEPAQFDLE